MQHRSKKPKVSFETDVFCNREAAFRFIITNTEHKRVDSIKKTLESVSRAFKAIQEEQLEQKQTLIRQIEELKVNKMEQQETIRRQAKEIAQRCTDAVEAREQLKEVSDQLEVSLAERDKLKQSNSVVMTYILEGKASLESNLEQYHDKVCHIHYIQSMTSIFVGKRCDPLIFDN
jgi:TolA-binding protein